VRCSHSVEGGYEVDAAGIRNGKRHCFRFGGIIDDFYSVSQPLNSRSGDENTAFHGVVDYIVEPPGQRRDQSFFRFHRFCPGIHQDEGAGSVRILRVAGRIAGLSEEGCLLVSGNRSNRNTGISDKTLFRLAVDAARRQYLRQHLHRNVQHFQQFFIPFEGVNIVKHRPAGITVIGDVDLTTGQFPDQP